MNVLIIDDDPFVCASLRTILQADPEITVPATGNDGAAALELYRQYRPDILLMDIQMPGPGPAQGAGGLQTGEALLREFPQAKILYLTTFSDNEYIIRALRLGAKGYLIKQDIGSIPPALKAVHAGQSVFGSEIMTRLPTLMEQPAGEPVESPLNERERQLTELVAQGLNNREIADRLYLSEGTVRNYISAALEKLELRDRTQLAVYYYRTFGRQ